MSDPENLKMNSLISFILPAKNEEKGLKEILPKLRSLFPNETMIVVDDGSEDQTGSVATELGATVVRHPYSMGNGAAIKSGVRLAKTKYVVCMDSDGQHSPADVKALVECLESGGYDMVVGARCKRGQASLFRGVANRFYNRFSSWIVGHEIKDLTSGFRVARTEKLKEFLSMLPNKFSYPTTVTMAFFRSGYSVGYKEVDVQRRVAGTQSHINLFSDGMRFLLIIFKVGTLYSPLKVFLPISAGFFLLGLVYYLYTYWQIQRFTNMSALLLTTSVLVFLMGLISEQITGLLYKESVGKTDEN